MKYFFVTLYILLLTGVSFSQNPGSGNFPFEGSLNPKKNGPPAGDSRPVIPGFQVKEVPSLPPPQTSGTLPESPETYEESEDGLWLKDAPLNEVFQFLAHEAELQFFHNMTLNTPEYLVTGQLNSRFDPMEQMEELALMYGVSIHKKGNTVFSLTIAQESILPGKPVHYKLKYLRPTDFEQIKNILTPFLTPVTGIAEYESKTNTIVMFDSEKKVEQLLELLCELDQPKQQVAIETRILRVKSNSRNRVGIDWGSVLGDGISVEAAGNLNSLFNLPDVSTIQKVVSVNNGFTSSQETFSESSSGSNLILSPTQMNAVVRALNAGGLAQQESSPTLVIEDNEEGLISIIDRVPIIVNTISETEVGQNISEEVRYKIDAGDADGDPETTREIGVSVLVSPTVLPDDTIRMKLRPRSAQIVEFIESKSGNLFPRVNESTVSTMARIPNGHSLFIGGFYEEIESDNGNKVPVLGDIPGLNLLFKSSDNSKEHTSLVFIVTPKLYRPSSIMENDSLSRDLGGRHVLPDNHDYPDREKPGFNHRTDMRNTISGIFRSRKAEPPSSPLVPYQPREKVETKSYSYVDPSYPEVEPQTIARPIPAHDYPPSHQAAPRKGNFLQKLFGPNR